MLNIGDQLILELKNTEEEEKFKCKVVEMKNDYLFIDYPISLKTNRTAFFIDGTQFKCSIVTKDNSVYYFETEIKSRVKREIPMLMISYPGDNQLIKIQRRQYVRIETAVDVAVHSLHGEFTPFVTVTDDISAGGAAIIVPEHIELPLDMVMKIWLVLPKQNGDYTYYSFEAKVVRILPDDRNRKKVSLEFLNVSPTERQGLLQFCFDRQVEMKKKGVLIR